MIQKFSIFIVVIFTFFTTTVLQGQINDGLIPQSCQVDWTNAGLLPGTSFEAVDVYNVINYGAVPNDGQNDYSAVMAAINAAQATAGLSIVYFPAGTYNINSTINLSRTGSSMGYSDIVLQGAGSNQTILQFSVGSTNSCINIYGVTSGSEYSLTNIVTKGDSLLVRPDFSMFSVNDWIHLCEQNYPYGGTESYRFVGQITQLSAIETGQATMKDEASKEYRPEYTLWIQKLYPIMNVGIENLKIYRADQNPVTAGGANINFNIAVNCWVRGVESDNTTYNHLSINRCSHIEISGNYVHHARSYGIYDPPLGVKGTGYGMTISYSSTNCLIANNIWHHLRHAMTIGLGANCNVFVYNYSREQTSYEPQMLGDICLHGRYPYANLFEQNVVCQISADNTHHKNGPYNAFLRNWVTSPPMNRLKLHGPIWLHDAPNTAVLGCETWMGITENPIDATGSTTSLSVDKYGYYNGAYRSHLYMTIYESSWRLNESALGDLTYYYSSRPDYLDMSYTWPSLGPNYTTSCSQSIPAYERYSTSTKTYLLNHSTTKTSYGPLPWDETWSGYHTITGIITVPSGVTLTISNSTDITLNGYSIISTGGTITVESGATINPSNSHTRLITGSAIKGIYSTIASAMSAATSGQSIEVYGSHTLAANLTVPSGVTLTFKNGSDITLDSHTIQKGSGALVVETGATFTPDIRLISGSTVLGLYSSLDAAYNDGTEVEVRGGTFTFNNTYVLLNGRSLKVKEGSVFEFPSGKCLDVRPTSTFEADNATFTSISGIWTGIVYRTSGNGYINECNISNATRAILDNSGTSDLVFTGNTITNSTNGIYCGYSGSPEIRNNTLSNISNYAIYCSGSDTSMVIADNTISNSTYGLYCYNANPQISSNKLTNSKVYFNNSNSELTNNLITVSGGNEAFYMYASSPTLFYNTISSTEAWLTIRACNGSDPVFGGWALGGYNYLSAGMGADGVIWASNGSHPVLGWNVAGNCETGPYVGGNNSIIGYMVPAAALDGTSGISAQYCWWGQTPAPYCYGDVNTNCPLPSDPGTGSTLSKSSPEPVMASHPEEKPADGEAKALWEFAMSAVWEKNYTGALDDFQTLIRLYPASTYAYRALSMSVRLCREQKTRDMLTYLDELLAGVEDKTLRAVIKSRKVSEYRRMKEPEQAIALSREILAENPETIHETTALFDLFNLYQKDLSDSVQAEYYLTELKTRYPEDELTGIARIDWGEDQEKVVIGKRTLPGQEEELLPEVFILGSAYPNPFNPVTRLTYSLPDAGDLVFEVVDITGRIVDRITFSNHPAGEHHFDYTASHLSTGLYIVRARFDRQVQIRKIVYMK